ncbi:MAG: cation:proton antiporter [Spirochaetales bacterium]|nr:cation:proton antiporter [Spirochaetales bacterium]
MSFNITLAAILLGGWLFSRIFSMLRLPNILGMVVFGILAGAFASPLIPPLLWEVEPMLKSLALVVILLRAGLGLSKATLKKTGVTALLMAVIPCLFEGAALTLLFHWMFGFDWNVSGLTAFMISAVSPAVIVPSMLNLKERGYGEQKGVPSIVLAGASVDDVLAITLFSVFLGLARTGETQVATSLLSVPLSIGGGIALGAILGWLMSAWFQKRHESLRATEKMLLLLVGAVFLVQLGEVLHSATLLGVMTVGFVLLERAEKAAHELAKKLSKVWIFAEIILFVLIGLSVDVPTALGAGLKGLAVISLGLVFRSLGVLVATMGSPLNQKERWFCVIAYLPKATVQAALGGVALQNSVAQGEVILALAVLSILFTAPLGLVGIKVFGKRLLDLPFEESQENPQ